MHEIEGAEIQAVVLTTCAHDALSTGRDCNVARAEDAFVG